MERKTVVVTVGAREYKLVSSADEAELARLAESVNSKLLEMSRPGRAEPANAMLLAAMALAHELEEERNRSRSLERRSRDMLRRVLVRLDNVLELDEGLPAGR